MTDETERSSIEFDGKRYERRDAVWFDVLTHLKAAVYLSQRIDISAKKDRTLWERCNVQDFADDPKNRSRDAEDVSRGGHWSRWPAAIGAACLGLSAFATSTIGFQEKFQSRIDLVYPPVPIIPETTSRVRLVQGWGGFDG
jgi:hypothetical protein